MNSLFNIFSTPPTKSEVDAERQRTERRLRGVRSWKKQLALFAAVTVAIGCWALFDIVTDEHLFSQIVISVFCGFLAAACMDNVTHELEKLWAKDVAALSVADRFLKKRAVELAKKHAE